MRIAKLLEAGRDEQGFTLVELGVVVAILGILGALAFPNLQRMNRAQATKTSATQMAGVLETARSRAVAEGTPHLVFVNEPGSGGGGADGCGPIAVVVRDTDRNYALSDGDRQQEISLGSGACGKVKLYGQDDSARPFADLELPTEDRAARGSSDETLVELEEEEEDSSGKGKGAGGKGASSGRSVEEAVVNGSTFPLDADSGRPVIAFSERGIPVDPENPTRWGSGAGAIYLTDGADAVFAAVVQPMGEIKLRKYEPGSQEWK